MIVKPAELTPLSAIAAGALAVEAGVPAGVLAVVPTSDPAAFSRTAFGDARVRKVSFTGSTEVGKILMQAAAGHVTRLSLELGGHAPLLVFADADLDLAVSQCVASKFRNGGQTCVCANRILVERSVLGAFTERLVAAVRGLKVGDGFEDGVSIGPLIEDSAAAKALAHVADAVAGGAKVLCGGGLVELPGRPSRFVAPTVLADVRPDMLCCREETFGPVAPILAFDSEAEAISLANGTPYGLAAYAFTRDGSRIMRLAESLDFGIVGVNDGLPATAQAPFGGVKESGFGREGGSEGLREYLSERFVSWRLA
jgi:succinate-semialdehyde dehydrogenase/glutarate-semialdehyde dehydrogenase